MFNKRMLLLISFLFCLVLTGCSINIQDLAKQSVSEMVEVYFSGTGDFSANISSGQREEPYEYNGKTGELKDFSVVTMLVSDNQKCIQAEISVNDKNATMILEQDLLTSSYVVDLGYKVSEDDKISIKYKGSVVDLECRSKNFNIKSSEALEIGTEAFSDELENLVSKKKLSAECYLRIIDNPNDKFNRLFWYFYIYAENGTSHYCVINIEDGNILTKS